MQHFLPSLLLRSLPLMPYKLVCPSRKVERLSLAFLSKTWFIPPSRFSKSFESCLSKPMGSKALPRAMDPEEREIELSVSRETASEKRWIVICNHHGMHNLHILHYLYNGDARLLMNDILLGGLSVFVVSIRMLRIRLTAILSHTEAWCWFLVRENSHNTFVFTHKN